MEPTTRLGTDSLKAMAHPVRMGIIRELSLEPASVSQLGERLGEPPNSVSFHVRQLERYGFVHRVEPPDGERKSGSWWATSHPDGFDLSSDPNSREEAVAAMTMLMQLRAQRLMRVLPGLPSCTGERPQSMVSELLCYLTPEQASECVARLREVVEEYAGKIEPRQGAHRYTLAVDFFKDPDHPEES